MSTPEESAAEIIPQTKVARHMAIIRILQNNTVTSQMQLQQLLAGQGIATTQATLSRDLFEMHATKMRRGKGKPVYVVQGEGANQVINGPENAGDGRLAKWCQDLLVVAIQNHNFVILRTPAGAAQLLASALDNAMLEQVIGCIAGDDTIFVMCTDEASASDLTEKLLNMADYAGE